MIAEVKVDEKEVQVGLENYFPFSPVFVLKVFFCYGKA